MHATKATVAFLLALTGGAAPAAAQGRGALTPLVGPWKVVGVDVADAPVQAVVRDDPTLLGAVLEVTPMRLSWRAPHRNSSLDAVCDAPRLNAGAIRCRNGSFGPPGTRLTRRGNSLTLPWYDGATLRLAHGVVRANAPALTTAGYDTIRIGAAPRAVGYRLAPTGRTAGGGCVSLVDPKVRGLEVIARNGVVTVIKVRSFPAASTIRTDRGIGIGSTEREVRAAYAPLQEERHKYVDAPAKNLYWRQASSRAGLRFEIDEKGRVSDIHAGVKPDLSLAEGCL